MDDVTLYYGLVVAQARKTYRKLKCGGGGVIDLDDLLQEANVALVEAGLEFDPTRRIPFAAYATQRINWALKSYLRKPDPLKQPERKAIKELDATKQLFIHQHGREPTLEDLAKELGRTLQEVEKQEQLRITILPLGSVNSAQDDPEQKNDFDPPSSDLDPETKACQNQMAINIQECIETVLSETERQIIVLRELEELTLVTVGKLLKIGKDTVARREQAAKQKLKNCMETKGWKVKDIVDLLQ